jgi:hypothetical protein
MKEDRIADLEARAADEFGLTDEEMIELIELKQSFVAGPALVDLGVTDPARFMTNLETISRRRDEADASGWLIEAIALSAYLLQLCLEIWVAGVIRETTGGVRWTLGQWIGYAEETGLDADIVGRLRRFNDGRNEAIHRLLRSNASYEDLRRVLDDDPAIVRVTLSRVAAKLPKVSGLRGNRW